MGAKGGTQSFVMKHQRNLDGAKGNDQSAHEHALKRQIIEDTGNVPEICEEKRPAHDQCADHDNDASPFQNIAETAHGEAKQFAFLEAQALYPSQANGDQINLNVDAKEVFEDECDRVDRGRDSQQAGGRQTAPLR